MFYLLSVSFRRAKQEERRGRRRWRIVGIFEISKITFTQFPLFIILLDQSLNHLGKVWIVL